MRPEILLAISDFHYHLLIVGGMLLLVGRLGNTRALRSLLYAGLFALLGLHFLISSNVGMAGVVLVPAVFIIAGIIFFGNLAHNQKFSEPNSTIAIRGMLRYVCLGAGALLLLVTCSTGDRGQLIARKRSEAIRNADAESLMEWAGRASFGLNSADWEGISYRPLGEDTLALIQAIASRTKGNGLGYGRTTGWTIILEHPPSAARLACIRSLAERWWFPSSFIIALREQDDMEAFKLALHRASFGGLIEELVAEGSYAILEEIWKILGEETPLPEGVRRQTRADFTVNVDLPLFLDRMDLFRVYVAAGSDVNGVLDLHNDRLRQRKGLFEGQSALLSAIGSGNAEAVELLLAAGADVDKPDKDGRTPLIYAILTNNQKVFDSLVQSPERALQADTSGLTPLHMAAWVGNPYMVEALLNAGAPPNNPPGREGLPSPLSFAATAGGPETLEALLAKTGKDTGELLRQKNAHGYTAFDYVAIGLDRWGYHKQLDYEYSPQLNAASFGLDSSRPSLENVTKLRARKKHVTTMLLAAGADPLARASDGSNVYHAFFDTGRHDSRRSDVPLAESAKRALFYKYSCLKIADPGWWKNETSGLPASLLRTEYIAALNRMREFEWPAEPVAYFENICRISGWETKECLNMVQPFMAVTIAPD